MGGSNRVKTIDAIAAFPKEPRPANEYNDKLDQGPRQLNLIIEVRSFSSVTAGLGMLWIYV